MKTYPLLSIVLAAIGCSASTFAIPVFYNLNFHVTSTKTGINDKGWIYSTSSKDEFFDCRPLNDQVYKGKMSVDDTLLKLDGLNRLGELNFLEIELAGIQWNYNSLTGNGGSLVGFRSSEGFASSPDFNVQNGHIIGWGGGVYGSSDVPFVDFFNKEFSAVDHASNGIFGYTDFIPLDNPPMVPEPSTFCLLFLGLIGFIAIKGKRNSISQFKVL